MCDLWPCCDLLFGFCDVGKVECSVFSASNKRWMKRRVKTCVSSQESGLWRIMKLLFSRASLNSHGNLSQPALICSVLVCSHPPSPPSRLTKTRRSCKSNIFHPRINICVLTFAQIFIFNLSLSLAHMCFVCVCVRVDGEHVFYSVTILTCDLKATVSS